MTVSSTPRVAAIIVNYRAAALVKAHLPALMRELEPFPGSEIYIIDNASPGDDQEVLARFVDQEPYRSIVKFRPQSDNLGFGRGNNVALKEILSDGERAPEFIYLLNPDAWPMPGSITQLFECLRDRPDAGLAGPRLESENGDIQPSAFRFFSIFGEFVNASRNRVLRSLFKNLVIAPEPRDETYAVDWICGAAVLIRREVFETVGLFDANYFLYYEETDLMRRASNHGWETWYVHNAGAVHHAGQSTGVIDGIGESQVSPDYWFQSRNYYFQTHHGVLGRFVADIGWLGGNLIYAARSVFSSAGAGHVLANMRQFLKVGLSSSSTTRR